MVILIHLDSLGSPYNLYNNNCQPAFQLFSEFADSSQKSVDIVKDIENYNLNEYNEKTYKDSNGKIQTRFRAALKPNYG